jgi:NAD(P)-dependent dehydrogenase (short-subunit alcohol dehydrogenase family)
MTETILITGAKGTIGSMLRQSLRKEGRHLKLLDIATQSPLDDGEDAELLVGSFLDRDVLTNAVDGVDAIVHLGGLSSSGYQWPEYLEINIDGTYALLEAARITGVPRMVYASSNHAVGFARASDYDTVPDYLYPKPDTLYGVSKAASESLCSLYWDRYGIHSICLRIGSYRERPTDKRALLTWLSPDDCTRLVEASLQVPDPGFRVVWGISANTRRVVSLEEGRAIGYEPKDDAEVYASELLALRPKEETDLIGGPYAGKDRT